MFQNPTILKNTPLYVHIPFCPKVCNYCDFAVLKAPDRLYGEYVDLVLREYNLRSPHPDETPETLYFGGGTPSILSDSLLKHLVVQILGSSFGLREFTLEANPETLDPGRILNFEELGISRLSLGVQSFDDRLLQILGRSHRTQQLLDLKKSLIDSNLSLNLDLMFALPEQSLSQFLSSLEQSLEFNPDHISFYGLSTESNTLLWQQIQKNKLKLDDELYADMYEAGVEFLHQHGLLRYEISNFAKPTKESQHNQMYWKRKPWLGIGPGAHSFDGKTRSWGPRNYKPWKEWVIGGCPDTGLDRETLSVQEIHEEVIWLGLRQSSGLMLSHPDLLSKEDLFARMEHWLNRDYLQYDETSKCLRLKGKGWLWVDTICADLF